MKKLKKTAALFSCLVLLFSVLNVAYGRTPVKTNVNMVATSYIGTGAGQTDVTPEGDLELLEDELNLNQEEPGKSTSELEFKPSVISIEDPVEGELNLKPSLISPNDPVAEGSDEDQLLISTEEENSAIENVTEESDEIISNISTNENGLDTKAAGEADDYAGCGVNPPPIYIMMQKTMGITKLISFTTGLLFAILAVVDGIKKAKLLKKIDNKVDENYTEENKQEDKKNCKIYGNRVIIYIVIAAILFFISEILTIITNFAAKPIIYIYPEQDGTVINVNVSDPEKLTCTYPKYNDGWKVIASKDGTLKDESGRHYYALYWEGKDFTNSNFEDGFVVKGEDTAAFLEEKLAILGLNEREAEEFIVYWLPVLESNNYNLIRFKTAEEIDSDMGLEINPKPDTLIRVMMEYKPLMFKKDIKEQVLEKVERTGYTVVEWGGIKSK